MRGHKYVSTGNNWREVMLTLESGAGEGRRWDLLSQLLSRSWKNSARVGPDSGLRVSCLLLADAERGGTQMI